MAIAEDVSTPAVVTGASPGALATASFSPPSGSLLVAMACLSHALSASTATVTDSGSHVWTVANTAAGAATKSGVVVIAYTYLSSAPGAITVTSTTTGTGGVLTVLAVRVLTGANSSQTGAATATKVVASGAPTTDGTISVTTTTTNSLVYGMTAGNINNSAYTLNGATSLINAFTGSTDRVVLWDATSVTGTPGATTFGGTWTTANSMNIVAFEALPAAAAAFLDYRHSRGPNYRR